MTAGVRWQLPLIVGSVMAVDAVLGLGAPGTTPGRDAPLVAQLVVGTTAAVLLTAVLLVGRVTWLRWRWTAHRTWITVVTVVVGGQLGLTAGGSVARGLGWGEVAAGATLDDVLLITVTTLIALVVLATLARHREAMTDLAAAGGRLRDALDAGVEALRDERGTLRARVQELLVERLAPTSVRPSPYEPAHLRALAAEVLRPLSHQLATTTTGFEPPGRPAVITAGWIAAVRDLRPEPAIRPRLLALTMLVLTFRLTLRGPTPGGAPSGTPVPPGTVRVTVDWASLLEAVLLVGTVPIVVGLGARLLAGVLARRTAVPRLAQRWALALAGLTAVGLVALGLVRAGQLAPGLSGQPPIDAGVRLGFTLAVLVVTVAVSLLEGAGAALARLRDGVAQANEDVALAAARVNAALAHERRTFARHLHASVQAAVNAASLLIERGTEDGRTDPAVVARAAGLIDAAVERLLATTAAQPTAPPGRLDPAAGPADGPHDPGPATDPLADRLAAVRATWEDIADVEIDADAATLERLAGDPVADATLGDLVSEACANAVVHGRATRIIVRIRSGGDRTVDLVVQDDGTALHELRAEGLGSRALEAACTRWSVTRTGDGTILSATLPVL